MTPSRGSDTAPGDLFFPVRVSRPLNKQKQISNTSNRKSFCDFAIQKFDLLDEMPEEANSAIDHTSSLGLLCLRTGHRQGVIHVTLLVQNDLIMDNIMSYRPYFLYSSAIYCHFITIVLILSELRLKPFSSSFPNEQLWHPGLRM